MKKSLPAALGRYQIESLLGRGGMGEVYKAFDPSLDRIVALKTIRLDSDNPMFLERLYREAKACGRLRHPRIVTVYDLGELEGIVFIAMEYLEGENLASAIDRNALSIEQKFDVLLEILDALQYAHSEGVIHRDIKPSNVLVLPDRTVKLLDFGLARVVRADSLTVSGAVMGTPSYMSPEQLTAQPIDGRTDVYSTGVVAYEMFTNRRAFDGDTLTAVMLKVLSDPPPPMSTRLTATFPELERVIARAMAKSRDERYATAEEMRDAINAFVSTTRSELSRLDGDAIRQVSDSIHEGKTLITGDRASATRESSASEAIGARSDAGRSQPPAASPGTMPRQTAYASAPASTSHQADPSGAALSAASPQPVSLSAAPPAPQPAPVPVVVVSPALAAPARSGMRSAWWIGGVTTVLAAGVGVMLMAGRGVSPGRDAIDARSSDRDAVGRGSPPQTGGGGPGAPSGGSTGLASTPPSGAIAEAQKPTAPAGIEQAPKPEGGRNPGAGASQAQAPISRQTTSSAREAAVYLDVRRSDAALMPALDAALREKGVAVSANASAARWTIRATVQISVRKSPIGDTSAMTADYAGSVEISDATTGMRRTLPFDGHALDFGEQVVRAAAVRRAAEAVAGAVQEGIRD